MKTEEEQRILREKYNAKMKLLALKLYEEEDAENARLAEIAEKRVLPAYAERAFESAHARVKREARKTVLTRVAKRAAACAAALALVLFTASALFGVRADALIHRAVALLFTETATYDEITTLPDGADTIVDEGTRRGRFPTYIPEGYELSTQEVYTAAIITVFTNGRENQIMIEESFGENVVAALDNEGSGRGKTTVNGETAFWTENEGGVYLYWPRGEGSVAVSSDAETLDTLVKIAESMKLPR